jgi:hypothetical protein
LLQELFISRGPLKEGSVFDLKWLLAEWLEITLRNKISHGLSYQDEILVFPVFYLWWTALRIDHFLLVVSRSLDGIVDGETE